MFRPGTLEGLKTTQELKDRLSIMVGQKSEWSDMFEYCNNPLTEEDVRWGYWMEMRTDMFCIEEFIAPCGLNYWDPCYCYEEPTMKELFY